MSNAPIHLGDKASYEEVEPGRDPLTGYMFSAGHVYAAYNPENVAYYESHGYRVAEWWSIYRTADGASLFTVNPDGTLRGMRPWVSVPAQYEAASAWKVQR